ncbi:MAG TPA: MBL fold metallo-hydrolase [Aggregatilineaceae bacterium]|nr:MBL fold metallo-hydrolase [Aggregatilineaceae bacterium]
MARLIILGSAGAVSDAAHDNTHFLLQGDQGSMVLVDCGSNPLHKLPRFGLQAHDLSDMILTHYHPDHVSGVPIMLMQMWLLGRSLPLHIYGLHHCLERVEDMMSSAYLWETWPGFFQVEFHRLPERSEQLVLDNADFRITSWPTKHFIPTIGLRIEVKTTGKVIGYSCDTEPIPNIVTLAQNVDLLLHEAAGSGYGHSSATDAGEIASEARAKRLVLIHYNVIRADPRLLLDEASQVFSGPVELAEDYCEYEI